MKCGCCGYENEDEHRACVRCGAKLDRGCGSCASCGGCVRSFITSPICPRLYRRRIPLHRTSGRHI